MSVIQSKFKKTSCVDGGTITVTGQKTNADSPLLVSCQENVKVIWKADYAGTTNRTGNCLIKLSMENGTFEVPAGGSIKATGTNCTAIGMSDDTTGTILVSGGTVEATGKGETLRLFSEEVIAITISM